MFFWTKPNINRCEIAGLGMLTRTREVFCGLQNINLTNDTTTKEITTTEPSLKASTKNNWFHEIKAEIMKNEESFRKS